MNNAVSTMVPIKEGNIDNFMLLRKMAWLCFVLQFWASIFYLFCSLIFPLSNNLAVLCGISAIIISFTPIFFAIKHRNLTLVFNCISAFNIAPIWFLYLEAVVPGYDAYAHIPSALRMEAFFWIAVFLMFTNVLYFFCWYQVSNYSIKTFSLLKAINLKDSFYQWGTILCFIFPLIGLYFVYHQSLELLWMGLTAGRAGNEKIVEATGSLNGALIPLNAVWQLTPLLGAIAFASAKKKYLPLSIVSLSLGILVVFSYFLSGSRGIMMLVMAPVLFFVFYYNWDSGLKFWISATAVLFVLIGIMELQVRFRGNLLDVIADPTKAARERGLASATTIDPTESHRDNNMYLFCLMVQGFPYKYPFQGFNDFFTTIVNPIPRAIWPGKPQLVGAKDLSQQPAFILDGPLIQGTTSLSYSVVGDGYQAGGTLGLFVYALFYSFILLFFDGINYYANRDRPVSIGLLGLCMFLSFWGLRGFFALISFLYPVIFFIFLLKMIQVFKSNENHIYSA